MTLAPDASRTPLGAGDRIADVVIERSGPSGPAALSYRGRRGDQGEPVDLFEFFPAGMAMRDNEGRVVALPDHADRFEAGRTAFFRRLDGLVALGSNAPEPPGAVLSGGYYAAPACEAPTLETWCNDLLRRPTLGELSNLIEAAGGALARLHASGLSHGAIAAATIHLNQPDEAVLRGFALGDPQATDASDRRAFAGVLYGLVTGRLPPEQQEAVGPDARYACAHIVADDYPAELLAAIDSALGLGQGPVPVSTTSWLARLLEAASSPQTVSQDKSREAPGQHQSSAVPAATTPAPQRRLPLWPALAAMLILMAGGGLWLASRPDSTDGLTAVRVADVPPQSPDVVQAPDTSGLKPVAERAPPHSPAASTPETLPNAPVQAPPTPTASPTDMTAALAERVATANDRAGLLALLEAGAPPDVVSDRLRGLGYVNLTAGDSQVLRRPGDAEVFRDCPTCPELVLVPGGEVTMQVELPSGRRDLRFTLPAPFVVGRFEITLAQFREFVAETGFVAAPGCHVRMPAWHLDPRLSWHNPGFPQTEADPVVCVSFREAKAYAAWLSRRAGQNYRLLSDAEWHHLAAQIAIEPGELSKLCAVGNGDDETARESASGQTAAIPCRDGYRFTAPVGRFEPTGWGLFDLNGNAWEWIETCAPNANAPDQPFPPSICLDADARLLRGGSWADGPAMRALDARLVSPPEIRDRVVGFRIARDLNPMDKK